MHRKQSVCGFQSFVTAGSVKHSNSTHNWLEAGLKSPQSTSLRTHAKRKKSQKLRTRKETKSLATALRLKRGFISSYCTFATGVTRLPTAQSSSQFAVVFLLLLESFTSITDWTNIILVACYHSEGFSVALSLFMLVAYPGLCLAPCAHFFKLWTSGQPVEIVQHMQCICMTVRRIWMARLTRVYEIEVCDGQINFCWSDFVYSKRGCFFSALLYWTSDDKSCNWRKLQQRPP